MAPTTTVTVSDAGKRLDQWLCANMPGASRGQVKKLLNNGAVLVNQKRVVIAGWKLKAGDRVVVRARAGTNKATPLQGGRRTLLKVYYEDRDVIVVEKPAGCYSVAPPGGGASFVDDVHGYIRRRHQLSKGSYVKPLHRLDVETSGILVLAKSREGTLLEDQFRRHLITRQYIAIVEGAVAKHAGVIDLPLEKGSFAAGQKTRIAPDGKGRRARTEFRVRERYANATLLDVTVVTGRTHQIRVHLAEVGHPLVGDKVYGGRLRFPRHALHAHMLGFRHPATGKRMEFHSPLPRDMDDLIDRLRTGVIGGRSIQKSA